jgi:hypothetical protein
MKEVIHRRDDCRACGSVMLELVLSLKPTPIGDAYISLERKDIHQPSYPIDLYMCAQCGLAQIRDVIDPDVLYGEYIYVTSSSMGLAEHFLEYAATVVSRSRLSAKSLVVDVGSNDGTLLRAFQAMGMSVLGIEPAPHIAEKANAGGVKTIDSFFTPELAKNIVSEHGHAKLVTANNVFANIDDLNSWVEAVNLLLADDGVFVLESCYLADLVQNLVFDFIYHEHLSALSVRPIQALFRRVGLELVAVQRVATKGGSLRYFIQRPQGPVGSDGSVGEFKALEERIGLYNKATFVAFAKTINGLRDKTALFLERAHKDGKSIAGFGASITCTTLIYHFEIGRYLEYLVDDNTAKQGLLSPGLHLPVYPMAVLCERMPDYVVILAWRFAEPFMQKNRDYLESGGHFIVPMPEFKIITNGKS